MRRATLILVLSLIAAACNGGDSVDTTTEAPETTAAPSTSAAPQTTTTTPPETSTTTAAPEVPPGPATTPPLVISSVDFGEEFVVITNVSDSDYSLEGHFVCNFPTYAPIGDLGTIAAGDSFTVELSAVAASVGTGEFGVYSTNDFANPDAMVTYVEWGQANHGRSGVAVAAGLWTEGDFVDNGNASFRAITTGGSGADYELME